MASDKTLLVDTTEINRNLAKMIAAYPKSADRIVRKVALDVLAAAMQNVPVDTGALRASGQVEFHGGREGPVDAPGLDPAPLLQMDPDTGEAVIGFTMQYAAAVHEDMDARHAVGGAKYLERAVTEEGQRLTAECAGILKGAR